MSEAIPKVQQQAIGRLHSGTLSASEYRRLLHDAAFKGWAAVLHEAICLGENRQNLLDKLLHEASYFEGRDHATAVGVLLSAGANPNAFRVMEYCGVASLPLLIEAGGDVNGEGASLIVALTERTKQDKALALIAAGADVNVADENGVTALMHAAALGRTKAYDALLEAGADPYRVDNTGRSLARQVVESLAGGGSRGRLPDRKNALRIARSLKRHLPSQPEDQVLLAVATGDTKELAALLDAGLDPNVMIVDAIGLAGFTLEDLVARCQEHGGLIEAMQADDLFPTQAEQDVGMGGMTLLMWATSLEEVECIRLLMDRGADPSQRNSGGISALDLADIRKAPGIASLLRCGQEATGSPEASTESLCQQLGFPESEVEENLARDVGRLEEDLREHPPERRGMLMQDLWEIASQQYLLARTSDCEDSLQSIIEIASDAFPQEPRRKAPGWTRGLFPWVDAVEVAAAACSCLLRWDVVETICRSPQSTWERGDKSPTYNPGWYEWPLWLHVGALARGEQPRPEWLTEMKTKSTRRSKAMLAAYEAIESGKEKPACKAIDRIVQGHLELSKKLASTIQPPFAVSPQATYFYHLALHKGLEIGFQPEWAPYIMRLNGSNND